MPKLGLKPKQKGQLALLVSVGKDIAAHERALAELRQTEKKLIKQFERSKYQDELDELRALVVNYENGVVL
jgi:hypothetical protein